ncbi:unnamed protein product, partial [Urochloa humidicola]
QLDGAVPIGLFLAAAEANSGRRLGQAELVPSPGGEPPLANSLAWKKFCKRIVKLLLQVSEA